jgi:hypothetical protein
METDDDKWRIEWMQGWINLQNQTNATTHQTKKHTVSRAGSFDSLKSFSSTFFPSHQQHNERSMNFLTVARTQKKEEHHI